jgi:uncharacterized protein YdhG (YjbR/CyaY superfamily)
VRVTLSGEVRAPGEWTMRSISDTESRDVREYLTSVPAQSRKTFLELREILRTSAPYAQEVVSYRILALRQHRILVWYAAFKDHCSVFVGSAKVRQRFSRELKPFAARKGTLQFPFGQPLPSSLLRRIVKARIAEDKKKNSTKRGR